jgi:hypothetical protein
VSAAHEEDSVTRKLDEMALTAYIKGTEVADAATDAAVRSSDSYADETALRLFVQSIPYIGPRIDFLLSAPGLRARRERLVGFLQAIKEDLVQLEESKVDSEFVDSPEFEGVVSQIFERVATTSRAERLDMLRRALGGVLAPAISQSPTRDSLLQAVDVFSGKHVYLLQQLANASPFDGLVVADRPESILFDLVGRGFVEYVPTEGAVLRTGPSNKYRITPLGGEFLRLLAGDQKTGGDTADG